MRKKELSNIIILNAEPNVTDIDNNNIRNTPFKFTYRFSGLIGSIKDLSFELENFIVNKFKNILYISRIPITIFCKIY